MKEIELIFLPGCPYCVKAKQAVTELQAESESYAGLQVDQRAGRDRLCRRT